MGDPALTQALLDNYVYQKERLLERAGACGHYNLARAAELQRHRIEKMADVVGDWNVTPDILMASVFEHAVRNRHPDGPMPNMLGSEKYIAKALSNFLQVPYEVVMEKRSTGLFLERRDFEYGRMRADLDRAGVDDLTSATSYPVEFRYIMAVSRIDLDEAFMMAEETLEKMAADGRVSMWMGHRGASYEKVAAAFNRRMKKIREKQP